MTKSSKSLPSRIQLKVIMTATNNVKANCSSGSSFWLSNLFFCFWGCLILLVVYRMWWPTVNCANDRLDLNFKSFEWQNPTLDKISFVSQRNKICVHTNIHTPCNTWTYYWSISQKFVYGFLWQCEITLDSFKTYSRKLILKTKRKKKQSKRDII